MKALTDYDLVLPQLPEEDESFQAIIDQGGVIKESAIVLAKGINLLKEVKETKATTERIGWLNLWVKAFTAMKSAIAAFESNSDFSLQAISRATFEWTFYTLFLMEPTLDLYSNANKSDKVHIPKSSKEYSLKKTVDRLRAFTAWCLWNDRLYYEELVHPMTIRGTWDRTAAKEILENEENINFYEKNFGELNIEVDNEKLTKGRQDMGRMYRKRIKEVDRYLSDSFLKPWIDKIRNIDANNKKKKIYRAVSFFDLFGSRGSIPSQLHKHELRFAYSLYMHNSMALHGSTMEQFIHIGDSTVAPKLSSSVNDIKNKFIDVVSNCNGIFFHLAAINNFVLRRPEMRS